MAYAVIGVLLIAAGGIVQAVEGGALGVALIVAGLVSVWLYPGPGRR